MKTLLLFVFVLGCGDVHGMPFGGEPLNGTGGVGGMAGATRAPDVLLGTGGTTAGGAGGAGAGGAIGGGGATGAAGSPGRPLAAGCTGDNQCASGFCAKAAGSTSGSCCSGRPDVCNTCIGGYLTPILDGVSCDQGGTCSGDVYQAHKCIGGSCVLYSVQCAPGGCNPSYCRVI